MKLKLSIVIKCSDDWRVFRCLRSIDEDVDVVVSLTPNRQIEEKLKKQKVKFCLTPKGHLSLTSNVGTANTWYSKVIIMDSDSVFEQGAIRKIYQGLLHHDVVKPKIIFRSDNSFASNILSSGRDFENTKKLVAYTPGLGINKRIVSEIGGFYFNEKITWSEDSELNFRLKKANIPIFPVDDAVIYHDPVTIVQEFRGAFQFGVGKRQAVVYSGRENNEDLIHYFKDLLHGRQLSYGLRLLSKAGLSVLVYMIVWKTFYYAGYYYQRISNKYAD